MFQKQTFGSNTSGFGTSTTPSFGSFKPTTGTNAFGAPPAFGASAAPQPATGGGLFGSSNTTGGLFGGSTASTSTPAFGSTSGGFGFGASTSTGGLFGNNQSTGLFGNTQNTSAFGAKPAGFGFGNTSTPGTSGTGLFGSTPSTSTGLFGQQNTSIGGGGLFTNTGSAFGQQQAPTGTGHIKYNPVVGTDVVVKSGSSQNVNIKHHCITCMKEYEGKSLEELRLEDYTAGRKGAAAGGMFTGFQQPTENKPLFGGTSFAQPATTSAPLFGGGSLGSSGFGQTNTFSFGGNTQNQTTSTGLFGNKPAFGATNTTGTGIFGAATTQAPTFGTTTPSFGGFGTNTQNQQSTGLFGAKPATTGFGSTPASSSFGGFGTGLFNAKPQQTTAPTFGSTAPSAFGSLSSGFGTNTSSSGFFGNLSKPNTTPMLGGQTQNTGFGAGLGAGLGTSFQAKPGAPAFGSLGSGSIFQQPQNNNTFRTGLDSGLGNSMFGTTPSLGTGLSLGGFNSNNPTAPAGASASGGGMQVHEQILTLAARPYGDSPLFKDLLPDTSTPAEEALKPTNPAALKAALDSAYKVASPSSGRLRVIPKPTVPHDKKSLFDGLEESDASLEDKLSLKPSRKRLVLRPNSRPNETQDSIEHSANINRSLEEQTSQSETKSERPEAGPSEPNAGLPAHSTKSTHDVRDGPNMNTEQRNGDSNSSDVNSDKHNWLSGSKVSWADKEKPMDGEATPRLYPNLDQELCQATERRASWLTTKPLRKPLATNPDVAESSVRELAVRPERNSVDKENVDSGSVSEEENVMENDAPPHPAGIKLRRPGYYTIPSLEELVEYIRPDGSCVVPHFTIGRKNYGNVFYDCEMDVANLDLDALVHFLNKEVIIYPEDADKPPVGQGLNRRAVVTLDRVWPRDKTQRRLIVEPDRLLKMDYEGKLRRVCEKHDTKFIEYRPQTGSWVFRVEHFSKYGLTDSDEEDDPTPEVLKRQLVNQSLQKSAAPAPKQPVAVQPAGLGGLGGLGGMGTLGGLGGLAVPPGTSAAAEDPFSVQRTSLDLLNGTEKGFDMDTTEDSTEAPTLYPDNLAYGVKSPTSELARLEQRQSHNVQLMKASLYADIEDMEEEGSVWSGDQLVPEGSSVAVESVSRQDAVSYDTRNTVATKHDTEEAVMKPLVVRPHRIVLEYHRKMPPFKETIAGRLGGACLADMNVCRARHSRLGFGPANTMVYVTSYDSLAHLPRSAELSELGRYVRGRGADDWSEPVVARLAIGHSTSEKDTLALQLESLLQFSQLVQEDPWPRLQLSQEPKQRRALLQQLLQHAQSDVTDTYSLQVWKLCDALWGADLDNDGIPGQDLRSIVHRHRRLLDWLQDAVADVTQHDLKMPATADSIDESDGHSGRVWTLLLGGRVLEACKVARENGDLHMATLLAQAASDPAFRSLVAKQLHLWQECGAHELVAKPRLAALQLIAGLRPRAELEQLDWLRALHATARYLCPQVPSLEQIVRTYESYFRTDLTNPDGKGRDSEDGELNLTTVPEDEMGMRLPLPPYFDQYEYNVTGESKRRRVLDLRYELLRARALNCRARLQPAAHTADPLDYSLTFVVGAWLGQPTAESITGAAAQLEARGHWHRAVQALAYLQDPGMRGHLIRGVLSRNAPCHEEGAAREQLQLVRGLKLPAAWLLLAQAHRAKYQHQPMLEAEYLVGAEQWNAAHKVLVDELLADAVLADNVQSLRPLLEKMNEAAERHEISGWESGGKALYHYMYVCDEVRDLVAAAEGEAPGDHNQGGPALQTRLEALRPRLAAACSALEKLPPRTGRQAAARSEMGARLVQLALAGGPPPGHLAALLRSLQLPPDCTARAHHKVTTDLAEQASELCVDCLRAPLHLQRV